MTTKTLQRLDQDLGPCDYCDWRGPCIVCNGCRLSFCGRCERYECEVTGQTHGYCHAIRPALFDDAATPAENNDKIACNDVPGFRQMHNKQSAALNALIHQGKAQHGEEAHEALGDPTLTPTVQEQPVALHNIAVDIPQSPSQQEPDNLASFGATSQSRLDSVAMRARQDQLPPPWLSSRNQAVSPWNAEVRIYGSPYGDVSSRAFRWRRLYHRLLGTRTL